MGQSRREGGWIGSKLLPLFLLSEKDDMVLITGISPVKLFHDFPNLTIDEKQMVCM
jgi:hypothetical protein